MGIDFKCGCRRAVMGSWTLCKRHQELIEREEEETREIDPFEQGDMDNEERKLEDKEQLPVRVVNLLVGND